jgi:hypothetical protein
MIFPRNSEIVVIQEALFLQDLFIKTHLDLSTFGRKVQMFLEGQELNCRKKTALTRQHGPCVNLRDPL